MIKPGHRSMVRVPFCFSAANSMNNKRLRTARRSGTVLLRIGVMTGFAWALGAIWYLSYLPDWLATLLAVCYLAWGIRGVRKSFRKKSVPQTGTQEVVPATRSWLYLAATVPVVYGMTLFLQPTNDRDWADDQMRLPRVTIHGDQVTIENLRDFRYRSPELFEPGYETLSFNITDLESVWFVVQRFSSYDGMAHTLVSFGINTPEGRKYFSVSVEIRREKGEHFSPIQGIYRQYELMYVIGSEQDLIGVRTNVRENDRVYLYQANATPDQVQELFRNFSRRVSHLEEHPEFYHTFLNNCTNNIVAHSWSLTSEPLNPLALRIVLPGYSAEVAFENGIIGQRKQSFLELQERSRIDTIARKAGITSNFSQDIRIRHSR